MSNHDTTPRDPDDLATVDFMVLGALLHEALDLLKLSAQAPCDFCGSFVEDEHAADCKFGQFVHNLLVVSAMMATR